MNIPRGALGRLIEERTAEALASGALVPIETGWETIEDGGIAFAVRVRKNVARKAAAASVPGVTRKNPFEPPYEEELYVGELSDTHVVLLNKFNVFPNHALIVTKRFEEQLALLTLADFEALYRGLEEVDGLAFYNGGGKDSGASQPHKHLQLVPFPFVEGLAGTPVDEFVKRRALPFSAAYSELPPTPEAGHRRYEEFLTRYGRLHFGGVYNLLATRTWMMVVPRTRECFEDISLNSLAFAGSLFVKNDEELARVRAAGPVRMLQSVTG